MPPGDVVPPAVVVPREIAAVGVGMGVTVAPGVVEGLAEAEGLAVPGVVVAPGVPFAVVVPDGVTAGVLRVRTAQAMRSPLLPDGSVIWSSGLAWTTSDAPNWPISWSGPLLRVNIVLVAV